MVTALAVAGADIVGTGTAEAPGADGDVAGATPVVALVPMVRLVAVDEPVVVDWGIAP